MYATAARGTEEVVAAELQRLGFAGVKRGHGGVTQFHVTQRFGAQQHADAIGERAEPFGRRGLVAQFGEALVNQWMID